MRYLQRDGADDDDRFFTPVTEFFLLVLSSNDVAYCLFGPSTTLILLSFWTWMGIVVLSSKATKELQQQLHYYWSKTFKPSSRAKKGQKKEPLHDLGNLRSWNWIYDLVGSFCLSTTYH